MRLRAFAPQERQSPTAMGILKYPDRTAGRFDEKPIMVDLPRALKSLPQFKLSSHDVQGPLAQCDPPILSGLCRVLVNSRDTRFVDFERLRFLDLKGVDPGAVLLLNTGAPRAIGGVVLVGIIAITEPECTSQHTDRIVLGLLAPVSIVSHLDECRV